MNQTSLNRFRLIAQLGKGGMSDVYLAAALGPGGFHKLMVLKVLNSELKPDQRFVDMFRHEARLTARLNHPSVVQTYEVGEIQGRPFIAMEYLEGQSLSQTSLRLTERNQLTVPFALRVLIGALEGLHYAHELRDYDGRPLRVVHRDATPQNVFLTYQGQIKLLDFGIAKTIASSADTSVGVVEGKVPYIAPEQARGEEVDRRVDVFTMGVVLWELLSGRRLWEGLNDSAIIPRLVQGDIPHLARFTKGLPEALTQLCMSALSPDPARRPQSALEFQLGLERQLSQLSGPVSQRNLGAIVSEAFATERQRVGALVSYQLERLRDEPSSGARSGLLPDATATPLPVLEPSGLIHELPTSRHTQPDEIISERGGAAVLAPTSATIDGRRPKTAATVPLWALFASVLAAASVVGAVSYWLLASRHEAPRNPPTSAQVGLPSPLPSTAPPPELGCDAPSKPLVELSGDIAEDATLRCDKEYLLKYTTTVLAGATLTIQAGTVIKGDRDSKGTLVISPGGRIDASGTKERPIVLTSSAPPLDRRAGDWGGVVILGRAPTNHRDAKGRPIQARIEGLTKGGEYGGDDADDSSGTLRYVRIEYSGDEIAPNNEINGLSLGGVGRRTTIDHVLVRHTADDCFEFFGGTVDAKYLVCQAPGDDAFDWDFGYTGRLQFLVAQAAPDERSGSNGFEGDNEPGASLAQPISQPRIYNATLCGKNRQFVGEHNGILVRRSSQGAIRNSIFVGYLAGLDVRDRTTGVDVQNTIFFDNRQGNFTHTAGASSDDGGLDEHALLTKSGTNNTEADPRLRHCFDRTGPTFVPERSFEGLGLRPPDDGFFDRQANYLGAVRDLSDDWLSGAWGRLDD